MTSSHNAIQTIPFIVSPRRPTNTFMCNYRISPNTNFLNQLYHSVPTSSLSLSVITKCRLRKVVTCKGLAAHVSPNPYNCSWDRSEQAKGTAELPLKSLCSTQLVLPKPPNRNRTKTHSIGCTVPQLATSALLSISLSLR